MAATPIVPVQAQRQLQQVPSNASAGLPALFAGMDRTDAIAFVSRLFEAAEAGTVTFTDAELVDRFLLGCSRTGSAETVSGYRRELEQLRQWIEQQHPGLMLRQLDPAKAQSFVDHLRRDVDGGVVAARSFNRRIAACSALYRWASEPNRASQTGIPRNPFPRRAMLHVAKTAKAVSEADLAAVLGEVQAAARRGSLTARRDFVMIRGSYLLGCRVSELARLRWRDLERLEDGGQVHLLGKGSKPRVVRVSMSTLELFESLERGAEDALLFPSNREPGKPLSRQAIADRMRRWGQQAGVHLHPHRLRHTHATAAVRAGVDTFTLQATLGHASTATTAGYVALNPADSSSLRLG